MKIAIVILNWNGLPLLKKYLPSLVQHSQEAKLYVIDNASTDDSIDYIHQYHPTIECIELDQNYGFAKGYNLGLRQIIADVFCLLNNDVEVTPNWLVPVLKEFTQNDTAIAQPYILDQKNRSNFEYAGAAGGFIDRYGFAYCRGRIFDTVETNEGQYGQERSCFWASGACLFIRCSTWHSLEGFDSDFFMHQEEIDLCWRAHNSGFKVQTIGHSTVYHQGAASLKLSPQKTFYNHRNSLWMLQKNLPRQQRFQVLFTRLVLDGVAGFFYLLRGQWRHFFMVLKAHASFYSHWKQNEKKRKKNKTEKPYYFRKSIVWDYFILKKRKFSAFPSHER